MPRWTGTGPPSLRRGVTIFRPRASDNESLAAQIEGTAPLRRSPIAANHQGPLGRSTIAEADPTMIEGRGRFPARGEDLLPRKSPAFRTWDPRPPAENYAFQTALMAGLTTTGSVAGRGGRYGVARSGGFGQGRRPPAAGGFKGAFPCHFRRMSLFLIVPGFL
jgi:hypothetical protein